MKEKFYEMLEKGVSKGVSKSKVNFKMLLYLKKSDQKIYDLISVCYKVICSSIYHFDEVDNLCKAIINCGIYYFLPFQYLLQKRYHLVWLECCKEALKKGREHKRDLRAISNRYEYDLMQYKNEGNKDQNLFDSFIKVKQSYCIGDNFDVPTKAVRCVHINEIYRYQFRKNKHAVKYFLNDFSLIGKTFTSYEDFKNEEKVQQFYKENPDFLSNFFYKKSKNEYDEGRMSLRYMHDLDIRTCREKSFLIDFLIYTQSCVLQILANKTMNDEQVCFLSAYGRIAFKINNDPQIARLRILDIIQDFPISFNNRCEDFIFSQDNRLSDVSFEQKILNQFRKEQRKKRPEKFYDKLLSLRKIALFQKIELLIFFGSICFMCLVHKTIKNTFIWGISFIIFLWLTSGSSYELYQVSRARFVY